MNKYKDFIIIIIIIQVERAAASAVVQGVEEKVRRVFTHSISLWASRTVLVPLNSSSLKESNTISLCPISLFFFPLYFVKH